MEYHFSRKCSQLARQIAVVSLAFLVVLLAVPSASGQAELGGRLRGTVVDPQGAAVIGAAVTLKNPATGNIRTATTNDTGAFIFVDVPAATYSLTVAAPGFRTANYDNVTINLNEVRALNAQLSVGSSQETVEVTGEAASVVPQETVLRNTVDEQRLKELPLNGRDFSQLVFYTPGVARGAGANGQGSGFNVAGARGTVNNFMIDGGDANDPTVPFGFATDGGFTNGLPIDAVSEFSVITSNASAEFGRSSGGTVNVVTKNGTNSLHGSLWEFNRNKSLNSRTFFDAPGKKSPFIQNQFGGYVGGPVIKDRTFFSGSYEAFRQIQTVSTVVRVPTSAWVNANVTSPLMKAILLGGFPTPTSNVGPVFGNFTSQLNQGGNQDSYFARADHNVNQNNQLFFTYNYTKTTAQPGSQGGNGIPGNNIGLLYQNYHGVANWNTTISGTMLNTARFVFQRNVLGFPLDAAPQALLDAGKVRTAGPFAGQAFSPDWSSPNGVPTITFLNDPFGNLGEANNMPQGRTSNTFQYEDTLAWTRGAHQFKFGAQFNRIQENDNFGANIRPSIGFLDARTGSVNTQTQFTFLNNQPTKYFRQNEYGFFAQDSWRIRPRVTIDLGLRYELSSPLREKNDQLSNIAVLDSNNKPIACKAIPLNGQLQNVAIVVNSLFHQDIYCTDKNNFAPRAGVSWDVFGDGKTVIRSSYGLFYDRIFTNALANARFSPPFTVPYTISGFNYDGQIGSTTLTNNAVVAPTAIDPSLVTPYTQRWNVTLSREIERNTLLNISYVGARGLKLAENVNPNFAGSFVDAFRPTNGSSTITRSLTDVQNGIIRAPFGNINLRTTHAYSNYNGMDVSVTHRRSAGLTFQANYTWSHSLDVISDEISSGADSAAPQATLTNLLAPLMTPTSTCTAANGTPSSAARLQAAVRCATGNNTLTADQAAAIFVQSFVAGTALSTNYGDSAFDLRHRFSGTAIYELPFGQGKRWGGGWSGPLNQIAGGWEIGTIFEAQTGNTSPLSDGVDANRDGSTNDRPILTGPLSALFVNGNGGVKVDTSTTTVRGLAACTGNSSAAPGCPSLDLGLGITDPRLRIGRGAIRAPGLWDFDLSANKRFKITERFGLQFRTEAFNILNHVNYLRPSRTVGSPSSFGLITAQRSLNGTQSRQIQFGLKLEF